MGDDERFDAAAELTALYKAAFEGGDKAQAEQIAQLMRAFSDVSAVGDEMEKVGKGERLLLTEEWAEARDVLASIDRSVLPEMNRPGVLNNLAYATAHAGDPERGIELIVQALKEAQAIPDYPPEKPAFMRSTHGIALCLAGKHAEAVALLEPLFEIESPPRARAVRAYHLGLSYRALGRTTDARRAFETSAAGEGPFAKRAEEALAG